jgi:MFS family permease
MENGQNKLFTGNFILICLVGYTGGLAIQLISSTMALYVKVAGGRTEFAGLLTACVTSTALCVRLITGSLSDKYGRKVFMITGMGILLLSMYLFVSVSDLALFIPISILQGIGFGMETTALAAASADIIPKSRMTEGMGIVSLGSTFTMAAGPYIGVRIMASNVPKNMFYMSMVLFAMAIVIIILVREKKRNNEQKKDALSSNILKKVIEVKALFPSAVQCLLTFGLSSIMAFLTLYGTTKGFGNTGLFFTLAAATILLTRIFAGKIADKHGPLYFLIPGAIAGAVLFLIISLTNNETLFILSGILYGLCSGMMFPAISAWVYKISPPERRGAASATYNISIDLGMGSGALVWGIVINSMGFPTVFTCCAILVFLSGVLSFIGVTKNKSLFCSPKEGEVIVDGKIDKNESETG